MSFIKLDYHVNVWSCEQSYTFGPRVGPFKEGREFDEEMMKVIWHSILNIVQYLIGAINILVLRRLFYIASTHLDEEVEGGAQFY